MGTQSFYDAVLPGMGRRVLAVFKNGLKAPPAHYFFSSNEELIEAATVYDEKGINVYHACATYGDENSRKGENAAAVRSVWVDLDVGPNKPYQSAQQAIDAIKGFREALSLPKPYYVASGAGIHVYWPFLKPVTPQNWQRIADLFAACLNSRSVQYDRSRTQDRASILRIPGTHNYKRETPLPVQILRDGEPVGAADFYSRLKTYAAAEGVVAPTVVASSDAAVAAANADLLGAPPDYPPSDGNVVAARCPVLSEVAQTGGDTSYEIWWRAVGVAKHTTQPEEVAAAWTRDRAVTGHDKFDYQQVLDSWKTGPTTCADFGRHSTKCADCKYNGRVKSPISLGYTGEDQGERPATPGAAVPVNEAEEPWEFDAGWLRALLWKKYKIGVNHRGEYTRQDVDSDGNKIQVPFCARYWQVMNRVQLYDGTWQLEIEYTVPKKTNRRFLLNSADIHATDKLRAAFGGREMLLSTVKDVATTQQLLREFQQQLASREVETVSHRMMGWATEENLLRGELTGEFVLGNLKFTPKKPPSTVQLDKRVPDNIRGGFGSKGDLTTWASWINAVYNRKGAEPYQFVICAALAAPLVRLCHSPNWHGMPISLTGDSGGAKTSTAMLATSIYGRPDAVKFAMNANTGDTINSLGLKMGVLNNLPFTCDEMSDRDAEFIGTFMYMVTNGMPKDRMLSTGDGLVANNYGWDTIPFITANDAMHERLGEIGNHNIQDATKVRCFEVHLTAEMLRTTFPDVTSGQFSEFLSENYGTVGQHWIQKLVNNRANVEELIRRTRATYLIDESDTTDTRFYKDLLMTVEVAAMLASKFGLIQFDIKAMIDWAKGQSRVMRDTVRFKDWDSAASDFIASLHGRTIVTKKFSLGRGRRAAEAPIDPIAPNAIPVARKAIEDEILIVSANYFNEWAKARKFSSAHLARMLLDTGWMIRREGHDSPHRLSLGSGTTVPRPQALCYEFNYRKIMSLDALPANGNVVPIEAAKPSVVTDSVTGRLDDSGESAVSV